MYFSLIAPELGREREAAHEWADGPYTEHKWLWRWFPAPEGTQRDFLFRRWDEQSMPRFYVVSKRPPQTQSKAWSIQTREYAPKLESGARLRFDLRVNPVVTQTRAGKPKRDDVVMNEKKRLLKERGIARWEDWQDGDKPSLHSLVQTGGTVWLQARARRFGFTVEEESLSVVGYQQHIELKGRLRFSTVDINGELTVVDPTAFGAALQNGIGPAKAFGCGLLLVRRVAG
ncbi:MAG: type I-E CRISPR-associated protein Cas6/Cse3/CasE [Burkholderiales bacterium]